MEIVVDEGPIKRRIEPDENELRLWTSQRLSPESKALHCVNRREARCHQSFQGKPCHSQCCWISIGINGLEFARERLISIVNSACADREQAKFSGNWACRFDID